MKTVTVEEVFDAPVEAVWKALTDKDEMKQWYFELSAFRAEVGFEFSFPGQGAKGENYLHRCKVTEVVPLKLLQYSWQYEGYPGRSLVTFELSQEGNQTRLRLTHSGLETFPQDLPDFDVSSFRAGWNELITKLLREFLSLKKS